MVAQQVLGSGGGYEGLGSGSKQKGWQGRVDPWGDRRRGAGARGWRWPYRRCLAPLQVASLPDPPGGAGGEG